MQAIMNIQCKYDDMSVRQGETCEHNFKFNDLVHCPCIILINSIVAFLLLGKSLGCFMNPE